MAETTSVTDASSSYSAMFRAAVHARDLDDYHHAISGANVGRMRKHGAREDIDPQTGERKGSAAQNAARTLEWLLLNNVNYAQAHFEASKAVNETFDRASSLLDRLLQDRADIASAVETALDAAATLPDGQKVFRDGKGVMRFENGETVSDEDAATIIWTGHEPSFEDYQALQAGKARLDDAINDLRGVETELGGLHGELNDNDTPPTLDRVEEIEQRGGELDAMITRIQENNPTALNQTAEAASFAAGTPEDTAKITVPSIKFGN